MPTLSYPSAQFPPAPSVSIDTPEDWEPVHAPGVVLAARRVQEPGAFIPNVVVRVEERAQGFNVREALDEIAAYAAEHTEGVAAEPFETQIEGVTFVGRDVSWVDDEVGTVVQAHLFTVAVQGESVHLIQATGSVGGPQVTQEYPLVQDVIKTLRISLWQGDAQ